jgi:hypothetical protein
VTSAGEAASSAARVYALAGSDRIVRSRDAVEQAIRAELGIADVARLEVAVHPSNGWIDVYDRQELWDRSLPPTLPTAAGAEQRARGFLTSLARRLSAPTDDDAPLVWIPPLPARPLELVGVASPDGRRWDHWLYRTQPKLAARSGGAQLPVFGAELEVRVGHGGQIVGFHGRWRPITGQHRSVAETAWQAPEPDPHHGRSSRKQAPIPPRAYVLEGAIIPQYYLAPYYVVNLGHHLELASASSMSLTVGFLIDDDEEQTRVTARVDGGSGDYAFRWARCPLEDPLEMDREDLGDGDRRRVEDDSIVGEIRFSKGASLVMVNVLDLRTGGFKHHQEHVFSSPFAHRGAPLFVIPDDTTRPVTEHMLEPGPTPVA